MSHRAQAGQGQAVLFPTLPPLAADPVVPGNVLLHRAGHKRRLAEAKASAAPFVEPTLPCRRGACRWDAEYRALPGRSCASYCPACPAHVRR